MDLGRIFSGLVGSSEENMRKAIKVAESIAPAILWIDEIEKGLSGNSSGNSDSGTASRVFGTLLTWMQEMEATVFVVATANSISSLPPELLRRGRFDEIFFTDLPHPASRREILSIHLKRKNRNPASFQLDSVVQATEGFSGAELEHCVMEGLFLAYSEKRDLKAEDLVKVAGLTVPLSRLNAEELKKIRTWAAGRARPAEGAPPAQNPQTPKAVRS
jgi:SpoVK/Ycf46/Vps4 family AAA+-type ATPase